MSDETEKERNEILRGIKSGIEDIGVMLVVIAVLTWFLVLSSCSIKSGLTDIERGLQDIKHKID